MSEDKSEVLNFYAGKTIFLTGATGFLGKCLIEKILYSCSDISKIYVLVREKKGKSAQERINQLFNTPVFSRLKNKPGCLSKIVVCTGDISETNLGLTDDQLNCLQDKVSVVFHVAATVNFNESLQKALDVNVNGTLEVIKLCRRMNLLQAFIYVSTAFCNTERRVIDEVVYSPPHDLEMVRQFAKQHSNNKDLITKLPGGKPNTYAYSKAIAEDVVAKCCSDVPAAIVRPSIVMASLSEPCPGWVDNWHGPTGLFVAMPSGIQKVIIGWGECVTDLVPVDIVTNLIIVAATRCKRSQRVKVYNCCTGSSNPIMINEAKHIARQTALKYSLNVVPWPYLIITRSDVLYYLLRFFLQIIPAFIADSTSKNGGRQMETQANIDKMVHLSKFFVLNEWSFIDNHVRILWESTTERDKEMFNFDVKSIDWEKCIENNILGVRKYLLKEKSKL